MGVDYTVSVDGLSQFTRGLKKLDSDLPKTIRLALNQASDLLIEKAKPLIPQRTGAAAASLRAASTRSSVRIRVGGAKAPYYPWLDFGGATGKKKSVKRPFYTEGRYLYPTLREHRQDFIDIMQGGLVDVARRAGIEVD